MSSATLPDPETATAVIDATTKWFSAHARDLPWRHPDCSPWGVLVSEFMLQQTPVSRVLEPWRRWLQRWPTPGALAAEPAGEPIREWGRLGYPRRALRLHAAANVIEERHGGEVPSDLSALRALPGVGEYTAAAVATFAFHQAHPVLDTNVRRVLARAFGGTQFPGPAPTAAERRLAAELVPRRGAAEWAAGSMELGALVCKALNPSCDVCPVAERCAWVAAGRPPYDGPSQQRQSYAGTDRQVRGLLMQVLRDADAPVPTVRLDRVWPDTQQRDRALTSLVTDGLALREGDTLRLP